MSDDLSWLKKKLQASTKKIIKEKYDPRPETRCAHLYEIIRTNNEIVTYLRENYPTFSRTNKAQAENIAENTRLRVHECLNKLKCSGDIPEDIYLPIDILYKVHFANEPEKSIKTTFDATNTQTLATNETDEEDEDEDEQGSSDSQSESQSPLEPRKHQEEEIKESSSYQEQTKPKQQQTQPEKTQVDPSQPEKTQVDPPQPEITQPNANMAVTTTELMRMCNSQLGNGFSGNPVDLEPFIDSISLLDELVTGAANKTLLIKIIRTKLTGKAREALLQTDDTVTKITTSLRKAIRQESSKIVEGRMKLLNLTNTETLNDFTKKVDELSEHLQRSLIAEKYPEDKARQIAVEKTIEVCRSNSRSSVIKAVLSTPNGFQTPQEVISTFLTQINIARTERDSKPPQQGQKNKKNGQNYRNNGHQQRYNNNGNKNNQNRYNNNGRSDQNNRRGNGNNNHNNKRRGNGNNDHGAGNSNANGYGYNNNNNNQNGASLSVHYTHTGNPEVPQDHLGAQQMSQYQ